jgi:hypothetical protein
LVAGEALLRTFQLLFLLLLQEAQSGRGMWLVSPLLYSLSLSLLPVQNWAQSQRRQQRKSRANMVDDTCMVEFMGCPVPPC